MFNTITYIEYIRYTLLSHYTLFHFYLDSNKDIGYLKVHTQTHTQKVHFLIKSYEFTELKPLQLAIEKAIIKPHQKKRRKLILKN